ncbi:MAG: M20/M25/M40 family metallo-hydrolase, partial [Thermodesulfobacteriota bacterium]
PLRQFLGKSDELDGQIGYGKGSMVFHMLRHIVGKDLFFTTLRKFSKQYGGKQASWEDIQKIFEEASGKRLNLFFSQWLDRPGGPQLKLKNVGMKVNTKGYLISGEVIQEGEVYQLLLPIEMDDGLGEKPLFLEVSKRRTPFSMEVPRLPFRLTLDPDTHLFRRLYPEEIIPGLNALLEDREKIFVLPDQEDEESRKIYFELAKMAKEQKGGEILFVKEVTEERLRNSSMMLLGESWKASIISKLISNLPKPIQIKDGTFFVKRNKVDERDESLLLTFPNPFNSKKWVTIYLGQSITALSRARYIFFYGWDSYILFKNGRPKERGIFSPKASFVSYDFLSKDLLVNIEQQRLNEHVSYLASPELAGRFPGTSGYQKAQTYLVKELEGMEIPPIIQPFSITLRDIEEATLILKTSKKEERLKAIPFRFSKEGRREGTSVSIYQNKMEEGSGLSGKGIMIYFDLPPNFSSEHLLEKIEELQFKRAQAILFFVKEGDLDLFAPYITYPSYFPPKLEKKLKKKEEEGFYVPRLIEASKVVARAKEPDFPVNLPIFFVPYTQAGEGWIKSLFDQKDISFEINLLFKEIRFKDANIGGIIEGRDPERKREFLLLGAHYDHLGKDEATGLYYFGADDNASGVSGLLEIGRSLMKRKADLRRSLILLFFGGEEWGLWGSRQFVQNPFLPLAQIKAMLSVDSIGGSTGEKEVFFVGGSIYPSLAQRNRRFLQFLGIKEGRNIDPYAFTFGSDHFPFHQRGIPALDYFASDYKKLHTLRDHPESIDFEKLADVTRLIYLTTYEFLTEP